MTILLKDMGTELITVSGANSATGGYTATSIDDVTLNSLAGASLNEPTYSLTTATGSLNLDRATQPKGIYLATNSEATFIAAELFYTNGPEGITIMNYKFSQLMKSAVLGTPIYVGGERYYYAKWYGSSGLGLYCFVGYSESERPAQEIAVTATTSIYDAVYGTTEGSTTPASEEGTTEEDEETVSGKDIVMGDGYNADTGLPKKIEPGRTYLGTGNPYFVTPTVSTNGKVTVTTTVPAQGATSGQSTAPTYQQVVAAMNRGWNTWARSISPLAQGKYLLYTTMAGIDSACLAIGPAGMEGRGIAAFSHSLIVDSEGLKVHENGIVVHTMKTGQDPLSALRIYRHSDNTIHYVVTTGTDTIVYRSLLACPFPLIVSLYVYGHLYSSGDKITAASFNSGEVHYGSV